MNRLPLMPIVDLMLKAGWTCEAIRPALGLSGSTWCRRATGTVSPYWADRRAVQLGFHPVEVWGIDAWLAAADPTLTPLDACHSL